ncbi:hypothetical protein [Geothrix sp. 21YS21S-4]|uniref:hypothetical protein n=1 Tax=Geothrix sp. 21YS21S-4 TaxID=3068889 RepID=UPI0027B8F960|nr:hypothetical protein [Geothrix sp. 21YS21S-4]
MSEVLSAAHRRARAVGWALCGGGPVLVALLMVSGAVPAGRNLPEGPFLQVGHAFTGLVFLSAAWVLWRRGTVLKDFGQLPPARQSGVLLRESLLYAALFELSSMYGLVYWALTGRHAAGHAWGFVLCTPFLFLAFFPPLRRWREGAVS